MNQTAMQLLLLAECSAGSRILKQLRREWMELDLSSNQGSLTPKSTILQPYWSSSRAHRLKERQIQITLETCRKKVAAQRREIFIFQVWRSARTSQADAWWVSSISQWMSWGKALQIKGTWSIQMRMCATAWGDRVTTVSHDSCCVGHIQVGNWSEMTWLDGQQPQRKGPSILG